MKNSTQKINATMNDKLGPKNYAKFDRTFMIFGSIMNGFQGMLSGMKPDEAERVAECAWEMAKKLVSEYVEELYSEGGLEKPL